MGFLQPIISFVLALVLIIALSAVALSVLSYCHDVMRVYDPLG